VIVSAGFDAAAGDMVGGCDLSAAAFGRMTRALMRLAGGKCVLALEGGYSVKYMALAAAECVRALQAPDGPPGPLDVVAAPPPQPAPQRASPKPIRAPKRTYGAANSRACEAIEATRQAHEKYWKSLREVVPRRRRGEARGGGLGTP